MRAPGGRGWDVDGATYETNPSRQVTGWARAILRLERQTRGPGGCFAVLPEPGGLHQQTAVVMDGIEYVRSLLGPFLVPVMMCSLPERDD